MGDGALGFWAALPKVFASTRAQRCWVHKTANILDKLPRSQQIDAKARLHEIWMAATREAAFKAFELFVQMYQAEYPKAVEYRRRGVHPSEGSAVHLEPRRNSGDFGSITVTIGNLSTSASIPVHVEAGKDSLWFTDLATLRGR